VGRLDICWVTAFLDVAPEKFAPSLAFWSRVTASEPSSRRSDKAEFVTLVPPSGDPYLRVQQTADGSSGVHLDLHVPSIPDARRHAESAGAVLVADRGCAVMASPGGFTFCLVPDQGERTVPDVVPVPAPHRVDQVSIDVPDAQFEEETRFWQALTGWESQRSAMPEFAPFLRPAGIPIRLLLQRRGNDDSAEHARAHLDLACGDAIAVVAGRQLGHGASLVRTETYWTTLTDPTGSEYCLTRRDPALAS
jgi:hypothetical protein